MSEQPFNHFSAIGNQMEAALSQLVRAAAFNVQRGYQERCRVDTGFQKNSAYVVTSDSSTYPGGGDKMLPEIARPESATEAIVAVGANYAIYNELGTVHTPGDGALTNAAQAEQQPFLSALSKLEDYLR